MDDITRPQGGIGKAVENAGGSSARQGVEDDTINLADYLRVISKHRRMIFWICAVTVVTTAVVSLLLPESYVATASVVPPVDVLQRESSMGAVKSPLLRQAMDVTSIADMYVGILRSRSTIDALVKRVDLATAYNAKSNMSALRGALRRSTSIKVTDEGIVTITVVDRDPCRAAVLANAYVEELDRQNKRLFVGQAASKKVFLKNRLEEIERELSGIDNLLSRDAKIKEMLFELLTREYEVAKIEEAKSMPTIQVLDSAVVPEQKYKPNRTQMVLFASVASFFAAIFAAFAREYFARLSLEGK